LRVASGEKLPLAQSEIKMHGHAIEARLCAEDPAKGFLPSIGTVRVFEMPVGDDIRVEAAFEDRRQAGRRASACSSFDASESDLGSVSPFYDSMIAKLIARADSREEARERAIAAIDQTLVMGVQTNSAFLRSLLKHPAVRSANIDTGLIGHDLEGLTRLEVDVSALNSGAKALVAFAGFLSRQALGHANQPTPWAAADAFQLGGLRVGEIRIVVDGNPETFDINWRDGGGLSASLKRSGLRIETTGADKSVTYIRRFRSENRVLVARNLRQHEFSWPTYDATSEDDGNAGDTVRAPINGKVARVFVTEGQAVAKGDRIAVVEAMKMEHVLVAGRDGTIAKVAASEGAQVNQGALIASLAEV
jgi:3-methylcrotonyl-CoA carboxylase alpha subunit